MTKCGLRYIANGACSYVNCLIQIIKWPTLGCITILSEILSSDVQSLFNTQVVYVFAYFAKIIHVCKVNIFFNLTCVKIILAKFIRFETHIGRIK